MFLGNGCRKREISQFFQEAQFQRRNMLNPQSRKTERVRINFSLVDMRLRKERTERGHRQDIELFGRLAVEFSYGLPMIRYTNLAIASKRGIRAITFMPLSVRVSLEHTRVRDARSYVALQNATIFRTPVHG